MNGDVKRKRSNFTLDKQHEQHNYQFETSKTFSVTAVTQCDGMALTMKIMKHRVHKCVDLYSGTSSMELPNVDLIKTRFSWR